MGIYIWYFQWTIRCIFLVNRVWELGKSPGILCSMKFWTHHRISGTDAVGQQEKVTQNMENQLLSREHLGQVQRKNLGKHQENPMENPTKSI